jgi:hypothetical protein
VQVVQEQTDKVMLVVLLATGVVQELIPAPVAVVVLPQLVRPLATRPQQAVLVEQELLIVILVLLLHTPVAVAVVVAGQVQRMLVVLVVLVVAELVLVAAQTGKVL